MIDRGREVCMSGRRSHPRFAVLNPWGGAIQVLRDVIVHRNGDRELTIISHVPATAEESMTLSLQTSGPAVTLRVRVLDSRPLIVAGQVRHQIRLALLDEALATCEALVAGDGKSVTTRAESVAPVSVHATAAVEF
jgi:hypothetical protein